LKNGNEKNEENVENVEKKEEILKQKPKTNSSSSSKEKEFCISIRRMIVNEMFLLSNV